MTTGRHFHFIAGTPAFCLVDTVGGRGDRNVERLRTAGDLLAWLQAAGLAPAEPTLVSEQDLNDARALREAIYRCGLAAMDQRRAAEVDIELINKVAAKPPLRPQWTGAVLVQIGSRPAEAALSTLAADALQILGSAARERIRVCPDCQMMFFDTSRPGRRRWCSSASGCGNRAKVRNSRARRAQPISGVSNDE